MIDSASTCPTPSCHPLVLQLPHPVLSSICRSAGPRPALSLGRPAARSAGVRASWAPLGRQQYGGGARPPCRLADLRLHLAGWCQDLLLLLHVKICCLMRDTSVVVLFASCLLLVCVCLTGGFVSDSDDEGSHEGICSRALRKANRRMPRTASDLLTRLA